MKYTHKTYSIGVRLEEDNDMFIVRYFRSWIYFGYFVVKYPGLLEKLLNL